MTGGRAGSSDFLALAVFVAGLLAALSVCTYDVAHLQQYPPTASGNLLGPPGDWFANRLANSIGNGVYVLLAAWFVLVLLLALPEKRVWSRRLLGWIMLVPCAALLAEWFGTSRLQGPTIGDGGAIGVWLALLLQEHFTPIDRGLIVAGCTALAVYLAIDFAIHFTFRIVSQCTRFTFRVLGVVARFVFRRRSVGVSPAQEIMRAGETPTLREAPPPPVEVSNDGSIPINHMNAAADATDVPEVEPAVPPIIRPGPVPDSDRFADFTLPSIDLLMDTEPFPFAQQDQALRDTALLLEKTFKDFGVNVKVVGINTGPVITQYEILLETGLRVNKVTNLADDLAINLKVPSIRIVAPIPGKNTVGVEVPNEHRAVVRLKETILTAAKKLKAKIPLFLGKDTEGRPLVYDLADMPHLLIAGRTGTGKSVCMNAIILSILMTRRPDEVKMIMIDPKMLELSEYGRIPHLMHPVVKDMKKAEAILAWAVDKMEERYDILSRARVRSIASYNELAPDEIRRRVKPDDDERDKVPDRMPYIVIVVDEMNDLMMQMKREVEGHIIRLAQKSRAAGIHLVVATQKPTVDVITGLIKSNLPARICFQVASRSDSRVVLDEMGADKLLGKGDMLFLQPGTSTLMRAQGTYASDEEITRVVQHLECDPCYAQELVELKVKGEDGKEPGEDMRSKDDMYDAAVEVVVREGRGSVSLLQRSLGIGYGRAARLIDYMAEDGIVGAYNGSSAREVLYSPDEWRQLKANRGEKTAV